MPRKGTYQIAGQPPDVAVSGRDASFAACVTSLLVFFCICLIIIFATLPWRSSSGGKDELEGHSKGGQTEKFHGGSLPPQLTTTPRPRPRPPFVPLPTTEEPAQWNYEDTANDPVEEEAETISPNITMSSQHHEAYVAAENTSSTTSRITNLDDEKSSTTRPEATTEAVIRVESTTEVIVEATEPTQANSTTEKTSTTSEATTEQSATTTEAGIKGELDSEYDDEDEPQKLQDDRAQDDQKDDQGHHAAIVDNYSWLEETEQFVCETGECKTLASRMLNLMEHAAEPCNDFYEYACGGLRTNRELQRADPEHDVDERIKAGMAKVTEHSPPHYRQFNKFYESCLEYEDAINYTQRLDKARAVLDEVGSLYDSGTWRNEFGNITVLLTKLFKLNSSPLFDVTLDVASDDRGSFSVRLMPPLHRSVLLDVAGDQQLSQLDAECRVTSEPTEAKRVDLNEAYQKYSKCKVLNQNHYLDGVVAALQAFGAFDSLSEFNRSQHLNALRYTLESNILTPRNNHLSDAGAVRRAILAKDYKLMTVLEVQDLYSLIDWQALLQELLGQPVPLNTTVQLYFQDYFEELFMTMDLSKDLHNSLLGFLAHELFTGLVAPSSSCDRPSRCFKSTKTLMDDVASLLYLATFKPGQIEAFKNQAEDLFSRSKAAFKLELQNATWLPEGDVARLLTKLDEMRLGLGMDRAAFSPQTSMNNVPLGSDYLDTFVALIRRYRTRMYAGYADNPQNQQHLWSYFSLPTKPSGTAVYGLNTVLIPLGVFSLPHFFPGAPHYVLAATMGSLIAHEMAHHFDTFGIKFGANGSKDALSLTTAAKVVYDDMTSLAESQFSFKKSEPLPSGGVAVFQVVGSLTLNERLADHSATLVAQRAYSTWLQQDKLGGRREGHGILPWLGMSWEQAFFTAQAQLYCTKESILDNRISLFEDEHFPPMLRVNDLASNSEHFSRAFSCQPGQPMNPAVKVAAFPALRAET